MRLTQKNSHPVICWDLDETIGTFRYLLSQSAEDSVDFEGHPSGVMNDIELLLALLSNAGYTNIATSAGKSMYVFEMLVRSGIEEYFTATFGREITESENGRGKDYENVAKRLNYPLELMTRNWIIVGDNLVDMPMDTGGNEKPVFIHYNDCVVSLEERMLPYDSRVLGQIIHQIAVHGKGDHKKGFEALLLQGEKAEPHPQFEQVSVSFRDNPGYRRLHLGQGISIDLCYMDKMCL